MLRAKFMGFVKASLSGILILTGVTTSFLLVPEAAIAAKGDRGAGNSANRNERAGNRGQSDARGNRGRNRNSGNGRDSANRGARNDRDARDNGNGRGNRNGHGANGGGNGNGRDNRGSENGGGSGRSNSGVTGSERSDSANNTSRRDTHRRSAPQGATQAQKLDAYQSAQNAVQRARSHAVSLYAVYDQLNGMTAAEKAAAFPNGGYDAALWQAATQYNASVATFQQAEAQAAATLAQLTNGNALSGGALTGLGALMGQ